MPTWSSFIPALISAIYTIQHCEWQYRAKANLVIAIYTIQYCKWQYRVQANLVIAIFTIQYCEWQYHVKASLVIAIFTIQYCEWQYSVKANLVCPLHDMVIANIARCMAYKRDVEGGSCIAQSPCNSIATVWAMQAGRKNERKIDACTHD